MSEYEMMHKLRLFVRVLCALRLSEDAIHGITSMVCDDLQAMDKLVAYIDENPTATESQVIQAASTIKGITRAK